MKISLLVGLGISLIALFLLADKFQSHTPRMAFSSLAVALQNNDQAQIKRLTTEKGLISLQVLSTHYGQKRLGDYLASHKSAQPSSHVVNIVVFMFEETKTPPITVFFKWTWQGWKLSSINGKPIFSSFPNSQVK